MNLEEFLWLLVLSLLKHRRVAQLISNINHASSRAFEAVGSERKCWWCRIFRWSECHFGQQLDLETHHDSFIVSNDSTKSCVCCMRSCVFTVESGFSLHLNWRPFFLQQPGCAEERCTLNCPVWSVGQLFRKGCCCDSSIFNDRTVTAKGCCKLQPSPSTTSLCGGLGPIQN